MGIGVALQQLKSGRREDDEHEREDQSLIVFRLVLPVLLQRCQTGLSDISNRIPIFGDERPSIKGFDGCDKGSSRKLLNWEAAATGHREHFHWSRRYHHVSWLCGNSRVSGFRDCRRRSIAFATAYGC